MNRLHLALTVLFLSLSTLLAGTPGPELQKAPSSTDEEKNSTEIFNYETTYTGNSDFYEDNGKFGDGDSLYNLINYAHRFHVTGNWYFRAGVEYERFDFDGTNNGLPDHLQTVHAKWQWNLSGPNGGDWWIEVNDGAYKMGKGKIDNPSVTFITSDNDWVAMCNGKLKGTWAFMTGRLKVRGSQSIARKLDEIFP